MRLTFTGLACLVPARRLPRPSRLMHFGDVSETQKLAQTAWSETHQRLAIQKKMAKKFLQSPNLARERKTNLWPRGGLQEKGKLWTVQLRHGYMNIPTKFPWNCPRLFRTFRGRPWYSHFFDEKIEGFIAYLRTHNLYLIIDPPWSFSDWNIQSEEADQ